MMQSGSLKQVSRFGAYGVAIQQNRILLVTKGASGVYANLLDLPGGGIEFGESPQEALAREFQEEVGMSFDRFTLIDNLSHTRTSANEKEGLHFHHVGQIYAVYGVKAIPSLQSEHPFAWYSLDSLQEELLTPFAREIFLRFTQGSNAFLSYF